MNGGINGKRGDEGKGSRWMRRERNTKCCMAGGRVEGKMEESH